jgi:sugar/nucleoside kinase (ribokinase family)
MAEYDVVTIGSATRDEFFSVGQPTVKWPGASSGRALVFPLGEKLSSAEAYFTPGGNAVNAAATFARNGWRTAVLIRLGRDAVGKEISEKLVGRKISTDLIEFDPKEPTSESIILLHSGERTILNYAGANDNLSLRSLTGLKSKWWYVSLSGRSARLFPRVMAEARRKKIKVAFNPTGYHLSHYRESILRFAGEIDLVILNEDEAGRLTGISFRERKAVFKKMDRLVSGIVVVTSGKKGATASDGRFLYEIGAGPQKVVDRTGAGDAFGSAFVSSLLRRSPKGTDHRPVDIGAALSFAAANAGGVIGRLGGAEGALDERVWLKTGRKTEVKIRPF